MESSALKGKPDRIDQGFLPFLDLGIGTDDDFFVTAVAAIITHINKIMLYLIVMRQRYLNR